MTAQPQHHRADTYAPGIGFPTLDGRRSTSRTGADVVADSLAHADEGLAERARSSTAWRTEYADVLAASTAASVREQVAVSIAQDGLEAARRHLVHRDGSGTEQPVTAWSARPASEDHGVREEVVVGSGGRRTRVEVPYRGEVLHDDALLHQLDRWIGAGVMEPGFAAAVRTVVQDPDLLAMPGHQVVLLGAGAAMGPLGALLGWGAAVTALDLPDAALWGRLRATAQATAGRMTLPVDHATGAAGLHLSEQADRARGWLRERWAAGATPVLGMYAYADGAHHVELAVTADVLGTDALTDRPDAVLAYLNTPTDSFLAPVEAVEVALARWSDPAWNGRLHSLGRAASRGRLFRPAYAETLQDDAGRAWSVVDTLVDVQGPNYALAKRIQRWRGVQARAHGRRVSSTVAPASWTTSVTRNRVLASVYAGAHRFGVEIFEPATVAPLLAAKLVADTFSPAGAEAAHPESLFADTAMHGGLWRQPFEPRTALGMAAVLGAPSRVLRRR
ncbi:MAG: hypothetical protein LH477_09915 [Nocardioides sp.]|nr:hypothetical protein [Nocardioides sp.]